MSGFYEILQVDSSADEAEIKRAYIRLVKKYPPEKAPEEFKKIRKAYEKLIDPISRAEYDAFSQYKDLIEDLERKGQEALENEDFKTAINMYKKILIIEPKLVFARNMLGLAFLYDKQYEAAKEQFEELIKISPDDVVYYKNLALAYRQLLDYHRAEQMLLKAHELDPIDDNIVIVLVNIYINKKEYYKAISFLEGCIGKNKADEFQDFIYYFEMIKVYVYENDICKIEETIDKIKEITPDNQKARKYVAFELGELAYQLYEATAYRLAAKISEKALELYDNDDLEKLFNVSKQFEKIFRSRSS